MALLDGKVALVSGAGPGLGRDIALACGRQGATVAVAARTAARVEAIATEIEGLGAKALALRLDVCDADSCRGTAERGVGTFRPLHTLVHNRFPPGGRPRLADAGLDDWRRTMDVNLFGTLQLTQAC